MSPLTVNKAIMNKMPILSRFVYFIVLPLAVVVWVLFQHYVVSALPSADLTLELHGKLNRVEIARTKQGITYISGDSQYDVYFATGFAHAQDRLWQMDIQRRLGQGRLSEVFGRAGLATDTFMRTLGLYVAAQKSVLHLSPQAREALKAYSDGVNSWIENSEQLPVEFSLLDIQPDPWQVADSLVWIKVFALNLSGNYKDELLHFIASSYLTETQFHSLISGADVADSMTESVPSEAAEVLLEIAANLEQQHKVGGKNVGSNAWVLGGQKTESGSAILANDPHLGLQQPSLWYAISQKASDLDVKGLSLVGLPVVIFGQNAHLAWGGTNMMADVQDLVMEKVVAENPKYYLQEQTQTPFSTRIERIKIKAEFPSSFRKAPEDYKLLVRSSNNGPVVSDIVDSSDTTMTMRWTGLDDKDTSFESFYRINYAKDIESMREALAFHIAPALNILFMDRQGNIGLQGVGKIPVRNGKDADGRYPTHSDNESGKWLGHIPFSEMPYQLNPASGYIVNANNRNVKEGYPYLISSKFADATRAKRIEQLLSDPNATVNLAYMQLMQSDVTDLSSQWLMPLFTKVGAKSAKEAEVLAHLQAWDGRATSESVGATIYYSWLRHLKKRLFADELDELWSDSNASPWLKNLRENVAEEKIFRFLSTNSFWCEDVMASGTLSCLGVLSESLAQMIEELDKIYGGSVEDWRWGEVHETVFAHTPFSDFRFLGLIFERRMSGSGAPNTISVAAPGFVDSQGYENQFGAGFRQIIEFDGQQTRHIVTGLNGQSGQVASPYYDNLMLGSKGQDQVNFADTPEDFIQHTLLIGASQEAKK